MTSGAYGRGEPYDLDAGSLEVIRLLAAGLTDEEIAAQLKVTIHTVHGRIRTVLRKTLSASRTEAAIKAIKGGLAVVIFMVCSLTVAPIERHPSLSSDQTNGCERRYVNMGEKRGPSSVTVLKPTTVATKVDSRDCASGHMPVQPLADRGRLTARLKAH